MTAKTYFSESTSFCYYFIEVVPHDFPQPFSSTLFLNPFHFSRFSSFFLAIFSFLFPIFPYPFHLVFVFLYSGRHCGATRTPIYAHALYFQIPCSIAFCVSLCFPFCFWLYSLHFSASLEQFFSHTYISALRSTQQLPEPSQTRYVKHKIQSRNFKTPKNKTSKKPDHSKQAIQTIENGQFKPKLLISNHFREKKTCVLPKTCLHSALELLQISFTPQPYVHRPWEITSFFSGRSSKK